jgi:adenylate kinase
MMRVVLTGTPGTGKTSVTKIVAKRLGLTHLDLSKTIKERQLYSGYDKKRDSYIADIKKVTEYVTAFERKNKSVLIDGHVAHLLPDKLVDTVIVLRCEPKALRKRLEKRRWNKTKVDENAEAEFIGIIQYEARELHKKVFELDTTGLSVSRVAGLVERVLKGEGGKYKKQIDWIK